MTTDKYPLLIYLTMTALSHTHAYMQERLRSWIMFWDEMYIDALIDLSRRLPVQAKGSHSNLCQNNDLLAGTVIGNLQQAYAWQYY
jgi:hypothetical protein